MSATMTASSILQHAARHAEKFLDGLDEMPVGTRASLADLRARFAGDGLRQRGMDPHEVVDALVAASTGGLVGSTGGRFFGWVIGGALPSTIAADWLTSVWDQNAALHATAPAAAVAEEVAGAWLADLLGIPASASVAFVTGCEMAHFTCFLAARHALLSRRGWDVERDGLSGSPRIRVLAGPERHGSTDRALRFAGIGTGAVERLTGTAKGLLRADALEAALAQNPEAPAIVLLQAGDINTGAFDHFDELIPVAHRYGAWVHIDGAFGLWASASRQYEHLMRGAGWADSWATDGHKWLNVPYDSGYAFVAHPEHHRAAMTYQASYLTHATEARDEMDWNPEWSRRARGFATWAALRELGREGVEDLVNRSCGMATALVAGLGALDGAEVLCTPTINQGLVRFRSTRADASERDHDALTDQVMAEVLRSGEAFFTGTTWRGYRAVRVSVSSWRTTEHDVTRSVAAVAKALEVLRA